MFGAKRQQVYPLTWLSARLSLLTALVVASGFGPRVALAQGADAATAEALFEQGKQLLRAGNAAAACPKLAESQRIDPSTGTLLALAMCHEADGKLASAWAEFITVEARARNEGRLDREQAAHARARALKPRLSTLEIRVPAEVAALPGLEVRRDGAVQGSGAWNVVVPIDAGEHVIEVSASGKAAWRSTASVKMEADAAVVTVPPLTTLPTQASPAGRKRWGSLEWTGVGLASAGVVGLGVGGYFLGSALSKNSDSSKDCQGNLCGPEGAEARHAAVANGNRATIFAIAGGALLAGGATFFVVGRLRAGRAESAEQTATTWGFSAGPAGFSAQCSTPF
jgi:hypothetical protein